MQQCVLDNIERVIDYLLICFDIKQLATHIAHDIDCIFSAACFRQYKPNVMSVVQTISSVSVPFTQLAIDPTKRQVLSEVVKLFDSDGFIAPIIVGFKIISFLGELACTGIRLFQILRPKHCSHLLMEWTMSINCTFHDSQAWFSVT